MSSQQNITSLRDFFGQEKIKKRLKVLFDKFEKRGKFLSSIFIYGPVGCGKNTLTNIIAKKLERKVVYLESIRDAQSLLSQFLSIRYPVIFVMKDLEELKPSVQRLLERIVRRKELDIFVEKEGRPVKVDLKDILIIGISSRAGNVPKVIRENFDEVWHFERYKIREIKKMIVNYAKKLKFDLDNDAAWEIAHGARKSPKRATDILQKIADYAQTKKKQKINLALVQNAFSHLGIDRIGLEKFDRDLLRMIIEKFGGGPVGIENFAAKLGETSWNIEEVHEPYLIEIGFLRRTPRGRIVTREAHEYLGYQYAVGKAPQKISSVPVTKNQKKMF